MPDDPTPLSSDQPEPAPEPTLSHQQDPWMPFRPYKRGQASICGIDELHTQNMVAAFQGCIDHEEVERVGGYAEILKSIRRHLPTFDPEQATQPFGPAWLQLLPILDRRCGLCPDESTTVTIIKAYLDDAEPNLRVDPKREQLERFRAELSSIPGQQKFWGQIESWAVGVRPFLRRNYPQDLADFTDLMREPRWVTLSPWGEEDGEVLVDNARNRGRALAANDSLASDTKKKLLSFINALVTVAEPTEGVGVPAMPDPKRVFVIYGQNLPAYNEMVQFLRALHLNPKSFNDVSNELGGSPTVLEIVRHGMEQAAVVVALFTPDEWSYLRPELRKPSTAGDSLRRWQARPNVIFEAGLAMGIDQKRIILVKLGPDVNLFSDVHGIHFIYLNNTPEQRHLLRGRLQTAGCTPDMQSGDFLSPGVAGDFDHFGKKSEKEPGDPFGMTLPASGTTKDGFDCGVG
jgi:predicted nucleotide-binding protein